MIDIGKVYYDIEYDENKNEQKNEEWRLILSKAKHRENRPKVFINLTNQKQLITGNKTVCQNIIICLRLSCTPHLVDTFSLDLRINLEIETLIQLLFTRFEVQDNSYPVDMAVEMIKRKVFQQNANFLQKHFEVFKLIDYIQKNINRKVTVDAVAKYMLMSQSTLRRFCIDRLGKTVNKLIQDIRIAEAKRMLETTDDTLATIAHKLDFFNSRTFSISFQKHTNYTPREYRRYYRRVINEGSSSNEKN
ncbi:hypothetical protein BH739_01255 [Enterococcus casseliflavus]|nr:hypothetical protein BH739_01255 [Enterococcus casseliflavus]